MVDVGMFVRWGGFAVLLFASTGCGTRPVFTREEADTEQVQLQRIGDAYAQAINKLKRGPNDLEELKPFLEAQSEGNTVAAAIASKQFIVIWGLDFKDLTLKSSPGSPPQAPVLAYEANSHNGSRFVLQMTTQVQEMSDDDFEKAYIPKPRPKEDKPKDRKPKDRKPK